MLPTGRNITTQVKTRLDPSLEAVAVFVTEGSTDAGEAGALLSEAERAAVAGMLASGVALGKPREVQLTLLDTGTDQSNQSNYRRVLVVGLGKAEKVTPEAVRQAAGALAKAVRRLRLHEIGVVLPVLSSAKSKAGDAAAIAEAVVTGLSLAAFEYAEYKGAASKRKEEDEEPGKAHRTFTLVTGEHALGDARRGAERGRIMADAQNFARTIASRPGNDINPPSLAKVATQLASEVGLTCRVLDEKELAKLKMGGILAVGSGSSNTPPRLIALEWSGSKAKRGAGATAKSKAGKSKAGKSQPLLVVGKSITFDSGGISIKPADKMGKMIFDKSGGMAVLGLMYALAKLDLAVHVVGILSSAENAISASAYRPGDILRMYNGVTVDVTNTDAEGRLVLGDALAWGIEQYKPSAVVDLATLTGAMVVALGHVHAGFYSNSDALAAELTTAAETAGEKVWRMPLSEEYRERIKGDAADIVNAAGRDGGCCTAAAFLSFFVPPEGAKNFVPWAHIDIAGVADTEKELPYYAKGSVAWGVRTLVEWAAGKA